MASSISFIRIFENIGRPEMIILGKTISIKKEWFLYDKIVVTTPMRKVATLHNLMVYLFHFLVCVTPLIFFKGVNEIFEFPKMTFVYLCVSLIFLLFSCKRILANDFKFKFSRFFIPVSLFLLANTLSTLFSIGTYTSIWGYYTRFNGGLVSIIIFTIMYFIFINELSAEERESVLRTIILGSIPVSLYGIAQNLGYEKGYWEEDSQARVFATLGQPNWLAAYLILIIPPTLYKMLSVRDERAKLLFFLVAAMAYASLWFTYSLSGLLGFGVSMILFSTFVDKAVVKHNLRFVMSLVFVFLLISFLRPGVIKPKVIDSINDIRKKFSVSFAAYADEDTSEKRFGDTTAIRLGIWEGTKSLIFASPKNFLIGTGPETFPYAFLKYRPKELNQTTEWNFVFNKPHNFYLEIFSNLGLFGFFSYLLIIKTVLFKLKEKTNFHLASGLSALFVSDFFGWHTVTASMLLYLFLGLMEDS
ncbi:hypothetical protein A2716_02660 [candidate division WWE3 bacterium RIFCSPHIGHO2_01_FULL_40_23]|uniref:O-antigen ligase-related domain-containing protein n=1 Tax=candidate division WWE3 bacterium RIFCSPLOWO2_01_FULL_41_18 TaxID=1802625 RepID=A0A1F4VFC0_UNCKA|nr:MAG: hypothetical protein A2716_02660 [candidate division WWE3 bacterium RIFCSPHIGHO2_01_FULL_40_23]OGC55887.1 MAG: hypothetical protein A3A78_02510 [candidate division WWE3 bacterium RIFCSPLOWO2_01_FULL_41_18]